jgi:hypothetical protein
MAKLGTEGTLHRHENSSRRKITAVTNSLLAQTDHKLTDCRVFGQAYAGDITFRPCPTERNVTAVYPSTHLDQQSHRPG